MKTSTNELKGSIVNQFEVNRHITIPAESLVEELFDNLTKKLKHNPKKTNAAIVILEAAEKGKIKLTQGVSGKSSLYLLKINDDNSISIEQSLLNVNNYVTKNKLIENPEDYMILYINDTILSSDQLNSLFQSDIHLNSKGVKQSLSLVKKNLKNKNSEIEINFIPLTKLVKKQDVKSISCIINLPNDLHDKKARLDQIQKSFKQTIAARSITMRETREQKLDIGSGFICQTSSEKGRENQDDFLIKNINYHIEDPKQFLADMIAAAAKATNENVYNGSTVSSVYAKREGNEVNITTAHLGDSPVYLLRVKKDGSGLKLNQLTRNHNVFNKSEKIRCTNLGAVPYNRNKQRVNNDSYAIVRYGVTYGGKIYQSAVTRSLGDKNLPFISQEPEIKSHAFELDDELLILIATTDGFNFNFSDAEQQLKKISNIKDPDAVIKKLKQLSTSTDDKTIIIGRLDTLTEDEKVVMTVMDGHGESRQTVDTAKDIFTAYLDLEPLKNMLETSQTLEAIELSNAQQSNDIANKPFQFVGLGYENNLQDFKELHKEHVDKTRGFDSNTDAAFSFVSLDTQHDQKTVLQDQNTVLQVEQTHYKSIDSQIVHLDQSNKSSATVKVDQSSKLMKPEQNKTSNFVKYATLAGVAATSVSGSNIIVTNDIVTAEQLKTDLPGVEILVGVNRHLTLDDMKNLQNGFQYAEMVMSDININGYNAIDGVNVFDSGGTGDDNKLVAATANHLLDNITTSFNGVITKQNLLNGLNDYVKKGDGKLGGKKEILEYFQNQKHSITSYIDKNFVNGQHAAIPDYLNDTDLASMNFNQPVKRATGNIVTINETKHQSRFTQFQQFINGGLNKMRVVFGGQDLGNG